MTKLFDFEKWTDKDRNNISQNDDEESINKKYENGVSRVITETGSYKVSILKELFASKNYNLQPDYQRRITWNKKKRSKLIESLIMNIPIPPIFLYEKDFNNYEIMDGLQRVSAIISFYKNEYALCGLEEWKELNGKKYDKLPIKIREGIDRRQILFITLLKETAPDEKQSDKIKRLLFERLNTGGLKLTGQEVRNALYSGKGNDLCKVLSKNTLFRKLWEIPTPSETEQGDEEIDIDYYTEIEKTKLERHNLYRRMYDVELILRYFSMRQINNFNMPLVDFLDANLKLLNGYDNYQLAKLKNTFIDALEKAYFLFGEHAFKFYKDGNWTSAARFIYDPLMIVLTNTTLKSDLSEDTSSRLEDIKRFYTLHADAFDGRHQVRDNILKRVELLKEMISTYAI